MLTETEARTAGQIFFHTLLLLME